MAARANEVVEIQLIAETRPAPEHSVASSDQAAAQAMIAGAPFVATRERPVSLLNAIVAEKKTLAHALKSPTLAGMSSWPNEQKNLGGASF